MKRLYVNPESSELQTPEYKWSNVKSGTKKRNSETNQNFDELKKPKLRFSEDIEVLGQN